MQEMLRRERRAKSIDFNHRAASTLSSPASRQRATYRATPLYCTTMMRRSLLSLLALLPCSVTASPFSAGPWGVSPPRRVSASAGGNNNYDRSWRSRRSASASTMTAAISSAISSPHDSVLSSTNHPETKRLHRVVLAGRRGKRTKQSAVMEQQADMMDPPAYDDGQQRFAGPDGEELTLEEMRARLGPVGKTVAGAVEVGMVTAGSYLSGGILGYIGGGLFGLGALARPSDYQPPPPPTLPGQQPPPTPPTRPKPTGFGGEFRGRMGNVNAKAVASAKSWAQLSAAFSGFHALTRVVRGGREDRWNGIVGSAFTGAYLNRQGGPQAMLQGATTYASFTYMLDVFFGTKGGRNKDGVFIDDQFQYQEQQLN